MSQDLRPVLHSSAFLGSVGINFPHGRNSGYWSPSVVGMGPDNIGGSRKIATVLGASRHRTTYRKSIFRHMPTMSVSIRDTTLGPSSIQVSTGSSASLAAIMQGCQGGWPAELGGINAEIDAPNRIAAMEAHADAIVTVTRQTLFRYWNLC